VKPTVGPTIQPSASPTTLPTSGPTRFPTTLPTSEPSFEPSYGPSVYPTDIPTSYCPTTDPTANPTWSIGPSSVPSSRPSSNLPTKRPSVEPSGRPSTYQPSFTPTRVIIQTFAATFKVNQDIDSVTNCDKTVTDDSTLISFIDTIKDILSEFSNRNSVSVQVISAACVAKRSSSSSDQTGGLTQSKFAVAASPSQSVHLIYDISYIAVTSTFTAWRTVYNNMSTTLETAVADTSFTTLLRKYANLYNVTGLTNAASSSVLVSAPVLQSVNSAPTSAPGKTASSSSEAALTLPTYPLIGVLVAVAICFLIAVCLFIYVIRLRSEAANPDTASSEKVVTTENPAKAKEIPGGGGGRGSGGDDVVVVVKEEEEKKIDDPMDVYKGDPLSTDMQENPLSSRSSGITSSAKEESPIKTVPVPVTEPVDVAPPPTTTTTTTTAESKSDPPKSPRDAAKDRRIGFKPMVATFGSKKMNSGKLK